MLLPRLMTAIIGIPVVLLSIYWGGIPFFLLMLGIVYLSLREYFMLAFQAKYRSEHFTGTLAGMLLFLSIFVNGTALGASAKNLGTSLMASVVIIMVFTAVVLRRTSERAIERLSITFFGAFFIPWTLGHLMLIRDIRPGGMLYTYFLFLLIWSLDTGAYGVGLRFGRHKLATAISPKKTVEGAVGGVVTGILTALVCRIIFLRAYITVTEAAMLGLVISIFSQLSDLSESLLKRDAGVKDSANLLPGHGGMLDRFDSFIFTAPLFYYYLTIIKNL